MQQKYSLEICKRKKNPRLTWTIRAWLTVAATQVMGRDHLSGPRTACCVSQPVQTLSLGPGSHRLTLLCPSCSCLLCTPVKLVQLWTTCHVGDTTFRAVALCRPLVMARCPSGPTAWLCCEWTRIRWACGPHQGADVMMRTFNGASSSTLSWIQTISRLFWFCLKGYFNHTSQSQVLLQQQLQRLKTLF